MFEIPFLFTMKLISSLLEFVSLTSQKYAIDESHGLGHSMNVLIHTNNIYNHEVFAYPFLKKQQRIIYTSAIVHDMCDKKYMNQQEGIEEIENFLKYKLPLSEIDVISQIISTMSYSSVKKQGFPNLNEYQLAYHIVREADLLSAYDFDRCIMYNMNHLNGNFINAYRDAKTLFENRIFKHFDDGLFITEYSKNKGKEYEAEAIKRLQSWEKIVHCL